MQKESAPSVAASPPVAATREGHPRWRAARLDAFDIGILVAWFLASLWLVGVILIDGAGSSRVWSGIAGPFASDQAQYLAWIRDSARHVLASNLFQIDPTPADLLHPGLVVSGRLVALGLPAWLAYIVWMPAATVALFFMARAYVRRHLETATARRCALVIALFFAPLTVLLVQHLGLSVSSYGKWWSVQFDISFLNALWGYPFEGISVAALIGALLTYERARARGSIGPWPPLLGMLAAWLQPWQGAALVLLLAGAEAALWLTSRSARSAAAQSERDRRRLPRLAITLALTAAPLVYYTILGAADTSWELVARINARGWSGGAESVAVAACLAVLVIPSIAAYSRVPREFGPIALRLWPIAGLLVFFFIALSGTGTFPPHALIGLSVPLGILAVQGVGRLTAGRPVSPVWAALATAALVVPPVVWELDHARKGIISGSRPDLFGGGIRTFSIPATTERCAGSTTAPYGAGS